MPCGESVAATGFEITFKGLGLCESFKRDVGLYLPWYVLGCMRNLPCIVSCQAGAEVGSAADVALVGMGETTEDVVNGSCFFQGLRVRLCLADGLPSVARRQPSEGWWRWRESNPRPRRLWPNIYARIAPLISSPVCRCPGLSGDMRPIVQRAASRRQTPHGDLLDEASPPSRRPRFGRWPVN